MVEIKVTPLQVFSLGADAVYLERRDPPIAPDGKYDWQASHDSHVSTQGHSSITNLIQRVEDFKRKGLIEPDPKLIVRVLVLMLRKTRPQAVQKAFLDFMLNPDAQNDRLGTVSIRDIQTYETR
jgi:linoleate 10R-lipoxygenase